jgi:hypothetical protein
MKHIFLLSLLCVWLWEGHAQTIVLYADQGRAVSGNTRKIASHWQNKGGGQFSWDKDIPKGGDYTVTISYATYKTGMTARIGSGSRTGRTTSLPATQGYYPQEKGWATFNCQRRALAGNLHLSGGKDTIKLEWTTKGQEDEAVLYSVELRPVAARALIQSDSALAVKERAPSGWFARIPYGVMFHWTSQTTPESGTAKPYNEAVRAFDVGAFATMVERMGAGYVILTTNHAEPYFPAPLHEWEKVYPGHTTQRDLVEEIADSLQARHIKLFLYMATHVYAQYDRVDDREFNRLNNRLVGEIGRRYKRKVAGYWFDGWYQCFQRHPGFDFKQFYRTAKEGNPDRLVCLNSWLYPTVSPWQDYWAGEVYTIGRPSPGRILEDGPGKGLQAQYLVVMQTEGWLHTASDSKIPPPHLTAEELADFITASGGKAPVTINMQIYQDGRVGDEALSVMEQLRQRVLGPAAHRFPK